MNENFINSQWNELRERVRTSAQRLGERAQQPDAFENQAEKFCEQPAPDSYGGFLERVNEAAQLAAIWRDHSPSRQSTHQNPIDEALDETFPASDPPSWNPGTL
ncbi:MAG: hypothetical protein R3C05_02095 [Pirellulaceae bacterium]